MARRVWFHRSHGGLTGGDVKHSHYFGHVLQMPGFEPRITFSGEPSDGSLARDRRWLWSAGDAAAPKWRPEPRDLLFIAGMDWRYLAERGLEALPNPRINLIQGVRHADTANDLYAYLSKKAVRICVSPEVADAVSTTGRIKGPVLTIPNGVDFSPFDPAEDGSPAGYERRRQPLAIIGYKRPELAWRLAERLDAESIPHLLLVKPLDRRAFLALLAETRVAVCLPHSTEGFYLPALEAMASGALVVTLDCVGNRGFCHHDRNCLIAEPRADSLLDMTKRALTRSGPERGHMQLLAPKPRVIVFAAFQFDPEAAKDIDETHWPSVTLLKTQMNADLLTDDLKKKRAGNESFWLIGQPDVAVERVTEDDDKGSPRVSVRGFDYFNTRTGNVDSGGANRNALWMLDPDHDGRSLFPRQVFFPMASARDGWARLAKNLKAEIDTDLIEAYRCTVCLPFESGEHGRAAVKIVDDRGVESLKVLELV